MAEMTVTYIDLGGGHQVVCYIWHEAEGRVKSNEFATLNVNYICRIAHRLTTNQDQ